MRNYSQFIEHLFSPVLCSLPAEKRAKKAYARGRPLAEVLRSLPTHATAERQFLAARIQGRSPEAAVDAIAFNSMFEQSYSSAVFNEAASYRLRQLGARAVAGDLVLLRTSGGGALGRKVQTVHMVTGEDEKAGKWSIFDVVLPLLSRSRAVVLPENIVGDWLRRRMQADAISNHVCLWPWERVQRLGSVHVGAEGGGGGW